MAYTSSGGHRRPIPSSFRKVHLHITERPYQIQAAGSFNKAIQLHQYSVPRHSSGFSSLNNLIVSLLSQSRAVWRPG